MGTKKMTKEEKVEHNRVLDIIYYFLRGICSAGGGNYVECPTACIQSHYKENTWLKFTITLCRRSNYYKNTFNKVLDLGHELGHTYKIMHTNPLILQKRENGHYNEVEATSFLVEVLDNFNIKLTKYELEKLKKLVKASENFDKRYNRS